MIFFIQSIQIHGVCSAINLSSPYGMIPIESDWFTSLPVEILSCIILLIVTALFTLYYLIHQLVFIHWSGKKEETFMNRVKDYLMEGRAESAIKLCRNERTFYARLIQKGISLMGRPLSEIIHLMEIEKEQLMLQLKKGLPLLAAIGISVILIGVIGTSYSLSIYLPQATIPGESLLPLLCGTAFGALILIAYFYLTIRTNRITSEMNDCLITFLDILNEPVHPQSKENRNRI